MNSTEINHMLRMLPFYYEHMDTYEQSTIARIYGLFTISIAKFEPIHIMIMQNSLP